MVGIIDFVMFLLVATNLALLESSRLKTCIWLVAFQGMALGFLPVLVGYNHAGGIALHAVFVGVISIILKGVVFPLLLMLAVHKANVRREIEPFVSYNVSIIAGVSALAAAIWISRYLNIPASAGGSLAVPLAFFTIFVGLLIITSRKKAITQVVGYLVLENGIFTFGFAVMPHAPFVVELGILLDLLVAVFVMGIMILHISATFDHIDVSRISTLGDE